MFQVTKIKNNNNLKQAIQEAVQGIGGFEKFIKKGDTVFLKPNFNTADPFPASSDSEFLKTVSALTYNHGAKSVILGDSSTMRASTQEVMEELNIFELEKLDPPVQVHNFDKNKWIKKKIPNAKYLKSVSIPDILDKVDKLILLPCLKTHSWADYTGALKLSVGFMKPSQRVHLHAMHLQEKIAELNTIIHPDLIIMDARKCFITKGPSDGETREPDLILASQDRIALDIEGIKIIQSFPDNNLKDISPEELPQIKRAMELTSTLVDTRCQC